MIKLKYDERWIAVKKVFGSLCLVGVIGSAWLGCWLDPQWIPACAVQGLLLFGFGAVLVSEDET